MRSRNRIRRAVDWRVESTQLQGGSADDVVDVSAASYGNKRLLHFVMPSTTRVGSDGTGIYELANAYTWRKSPGGLAGMVTAWDADGVQALDVGTEADTLYSFVLIEDVPYLMLHKETYDSNTLAHRVLAEIISSAGANNIPAYLVDGRSMMGNTELSYGANSRARFLLDNWAEDKYRNRFVLDGEVTRHPIDVALMFMLSMDRELYLSDTAAGSSSTVVWFADSGAQNDEWNGYALFCMEDTNGALAQECRLITDSTTTKITVEQAFSGAPAAAKEFQVRNSIYDVLPFGWGMGIDALGVDIDSFLSIRDEFLPDCELGKFILGVQDEIDIWEMLQTHIFRPYGILVYFDHETRKITARHIGTTAEDGTFEDYTAINTEHIFKPGKLSQTFSNPVGAVNLKVRQVENRVIGVGAAIRSQAGTQYDAGIRIAVTGRVPALQGGKTTNIILRSEELNFAFTEHDLDQIEIEALLNTEDDYTPLAGRLLGMLGEYTVPPPAWGAPIDMVLHQSCKPGSLVLINWLSPDAPANPFTGSRGWTNVIGRVLSRGYKFRGSPTFPLEVELLLANAVGRLAPAAIVTGKGADGNGAYFVCDTTESFVDPDTDKDWYYFAVGDVLEYRDTTGAVKGGWVNRAIAAFGVVQSSTPEGSGDTRIYLDGAIAPAWVAGDYITFADWSNATTRMELYSAYASAAGLLNGVDNARKYA
jgi:hypothetical protein